jgi:hypothetical protein
VLFQRTIAEAAIGWAVVRQVTGDWQIDGHRVWYADDGPVP